MFIQQKTKQLLAVIFFFGLAGAVWGYFMWRDVSASTEFEQPLHWVGVLSFAILGGLGLTIFSGNIKKILATVGLGIPASIIGFFLPLLFGYWLLLFGRALLPLFFLPLSPLNIDFESLINLRHSLTIGAFWLQFFISSLVISLFYALILNKKLSLKLWRVWIGFGLTMIISPILGNLVGESIFNSLFIAHLLTFILISITFGLSLFWGLSKAKK